MGNSLGDGLGSTDGNGDRLVFSGSTSDFTTAFNQADVNFSGFGQGYAAISFGSTYEIVPVPEPSSTALLGSAGLLALVGFRERRRLCSALRRTQARG
jgi:hypothetical protein